MKQQKIVTYYSIMWCSMKKIYTEELSSAVQGQPFNSRQNVSPWEVKSFATDQGKITKRRLRGLQFVQQ